MSHICPRVLGGGVVTESGCAPDIDIGCVCDDFDINF